MQNTKKSLYQKMNAKKAHLTDAKVYHKQELKEIEQELKEVNRVIEALSQEDQIDMFEEEL